jgi:predicted ATPase
MVRQARLPILRLTRLELEQWKNFSRVGVELQERVFVVGPNASGKSNLLDAVRFLHELAASDGGLQEAVARRDGVSAIRCLAARRDPDIGIKVWLGTSAAPRAWSYHVRFSYDRDLGGPVITAERVERDGVELLSRPNDDDRRDPKRLTQTHLEQVTANQEVRAIAELFQSIQYRHLVPQIVREPDRSAGSRHDPYGSDFLETVAETRAQTRGARLRRITAALKVAVPQLSELELGRDHRGVPHLRGRSEHWRQRGAWQTERQLSDGTLRLLGLLWSLLEGDGPLLLEEPELSLHRDVVRRIPQMFARLQRQSGRQVIVSTHSVDLLNDEGIGLDEVLLLVPEGEGTTVRTPRDFAEVLALVDGGLPLGEAILPRVAPGRTEQLAKFPDLGD